jgi:hypothetical protein
MSTYLPRLVGRTDRDLQVDGPMSGPADRSRALVVDSMLVRIIAEIDTGTTKDPSEALEVVEEAPSSGKPLLMACQMCHSFPMVNIMQETPYC